MADETQTQDVQVDESSQSALNALEGMGIDTKNLADKIKAEMKTATPAAEEEKVEAGTKVVPEAGTPAAEEEVKITIPKEIKVGDEIKAGDAPAPDGEYLRADESVIVIKGGKIEEIKPKEVIPGRVEVIDNPFIGKEKSEEVPANITDYSQAAGYLTENLGIEINSPQDMSKVVDRMKELNTTISEAQDEKSVLTQYKAVFENMPDDLFAITSKWLNEEDYHDEIVAVSRRNIDFSKAFSEHKLKDLIEHYYPGKFSEEDYLDMDDDKAMKAVADLVKQTYVADKSRYSGIKEKHHDEVAKVQKAFKASIDGSIQTLATSVPYLKDHHKQKVAGVLKQGTAGILSLFVDENGMIKPEAGKLIALAIYGEDAITSQSKIAHNRGETQAKEEIVKRTPTKQEKKSVAAGSVSSSGDADAVRQFQQKVIPSVNENNPFMKPYTGE